MRTFSWTISAVASLALVACGGNTVNTDPSTGTGGTGTTGGVVAGTSTGAPIDYPTPISPQVNGIGVGNTFPNIALAGGALLNFAPTVTLDCSPKDACTTNSPNFAPSFTYQDLYFAGKPAGQVNTDVARQNITGQAFRYAFVDISAIWCIHCNQEAATLPSQYVAKWLEQGGIVFSILVQDSGGAAPATDTGLFTWIRQYQLNYPISIDSQENMLTTATIKAWPGNVIVRLHDMKVIESVLGAGDSFYDDFTKHLTDCQNDPTIPNDCYPNSTCQANSMSSTGFSCVAN